MISIWISSDYHLNIIWLAPDSHLVLIWFSSESHLISMWIYHLTIIRFSSEYHLIIIWLSSDSHLNIIWFLSDSHLMLISLSSDFHLNITWLSSTSFQIFMLGVRATNLRYVTGEIFLPSPVILWCGKRTPHDTTCQMVLNISEPRQLPLAISSIVQSSPKLKIWML